MKKFLVTLQVLACCSLFAQDSEVAKSEMKKEKTDPCKKECAPDPCPCFMRGDDPIEGMPMTCKYPAAFNHPANVKVEGCWDVYADVSYLYWFSEEEGLDLGTYAVMTTGAQVIDQPNTKGFVLLQDTKYNSAFKAGIGCNLNVDDWVADLEYTYYRNHTTTSSTAPTSTLGTGVYYLNGWFFQKNTGNAAGIGSQGAAASALTSKWRMNLDWIDLTFKRPFYQGRRLTVTPSAGLRASWIRQSVSIAANVTNMNTTPLTQNNVHSHNRSYSWGIGPRMLMDAHWLVGAGFRFQGSAGGSLLFTQYTKITHQEDQMPTAAGTLRYPVSFSVHDYNVLRPMLEANLGIGWGSYFSRNSYHFDFSATYDFNYLWSQNMIRYMLEMNGNVGNAAAPLDLFLHGLTLKARFDF
ncbi:MAG: hypothetical protein JSS32_07180 [Verrucomicrobia bacterium]|nr:hypothetical protein [Verrucomicrobiota bacterium]